MSFSEQGGTLKESGAHVAVMEWAGATRQMCVSVTDVFWVSRPGRVSGARGININPSKEKHGCNDAKFVLVGN